MITWFTYVMIKFMFQISDKIQLTAWSRKFHHRDWNSVCFIFRRICGASTVIQFLLMMTIMTTS